MRKQVVIIGIGRFGHSLATSLAARGCDVIVIDKDEEKIKDIADSVAGAFVLDALDAKALMDVGVKSADLTVVSIGENVEANIIAVMTLKELGVENIIAKAVTELHGRVLEHLRVSRIVHPERDMAQRLANTILRPDVIESFELSDGYSIVEMEAPSFMHDKTIMESGLRAGYGLTIIAIKRADKAINVNPSADTGVAPGDVLVVLGSNADIDRAR